MPAEEQIRILKMIEQGEIKAEDGARLLEALDAADRRRTPATPPAGSVAGSGRNLRVRVTDTRTGRNKVDVTIPIGLVDVGLRMGARFVPEMEGIDLHQVAALIKQGNTGQLIKIEDPEDNEIIEIFVE
ncbi:MAG: hypothetical protein WAZ19_16140 [Anaerolineae bacterium]